MPAISRIDNEINFDWGLGLVTLDVADFVSARWFGKVLAPATEEFTFIIHADDGVRFYFDGVLVIDRWDKCCEDVTSTQSLVSGTFYDIMIEFKEYQEEAYISLMWTSLSFPKGVISPKYLYYPERVGSSPYDIVINFGPSSADQSTAVGDGLSKAIAGKLSTIFIQSRNSIGDIIDNTNDNYQLYFKGPNGLTTGEFYAYGVYQSNGLYKSQYVP